MRSELYRIDGPWQNRLAIVPRPRGGDWLEDEIRAWRAAGVDVVVSLLTPDEVAELDLAHEATICETYGIQCLPFPIVDRGVPTSRATTLELATKLDDLLADGKSVAIHCRQGVGRSGLLAACVLLCAGLDPETSLRRVSAARGCPVPETSEQRQWVETFAQEVLAFPSKE